MRSRRVDVFRRTFLKKLPKIPGVSFRRTLTSLINVAPLINVALDNFSRINKRSPFNKRSLGYIISQYLINVAPFNQIFRFQAFFQIQGNYLGILNLKSWEKFRSRVIFQCKNIRETAYISEKTLFKYLCRSPWKKIWKLINVASLIRE